MNTIETKEKELLTDGDRERQLSMNGLGGLTTTRLHPQRTRTKQGTGSRWKVSSSRLRRPASATKRRAEVRRVRSSPFSHSERTTESEIDPREMKWSAHLSSFPAAWMPVGEEGNDRGALRRGSIFSTH